MAVYIAQYKGKSLTSKIIKFITRSIYSHSAFWIVNGKNHYCIEAWHKGGLRKTRSLSENHKPNTEVDLFALKPPLSRKQEQKLIKLITADLKQKPSIKYDFKHVLMFLPIFRALMGDRDVGHQYFCAEYVLQRLLDVGYKLLNIEPFRASPEDVVQSTKLRKVTTLITS